MVRRVVGQIRCRLQCLIRIIQKTSFWSCCSSDSRMRSLYYDNCWDTKKPSFFFLNIRKQGKRNYYQVFVPDVIKECCLSLMYFSSSRPMRFPQIHLMFFPSRILKSSMILSFQQRHNFPLPIFTYLKIFRLHFWHLITSMEHRHFLKMERKHNYILFSSFSFYNLIRTKI